MRTQVQKLVILSAFQADKDIVYNTRSHSKLKGRIEELFGKGSTFDLNGVYKGIPELSIAVRVTNEFDIEPLSVQAAEYNQETILYISGEQQGHLVTLDTGWVQNIGNMVSDNRPPPPHYEENYSHIPETETYFWFHRKQRDKVIPISVKRLD